VKPHVYLIGPTTGYHDLNRESFAEAEEAMVSRGMAVVNPTKLLTDVTQSTLIAVPLIITCHLGLALPGWRRCEHAIIQVLILHHLGHPVFEYPSMEVIEQARLPRLETPVS